MAAGGLGPVSVPGTLCCWEAAGHGQGRPGVSTLRQETPRSQPGPALAPELAPPALPAARTPSRACARESPRGRVSRTGPNGQHWGKKKWGPAAASLRAEGRPRPRSAWGGRGQRASQVPHSVRGPDGRLSSPVSCSVTVAAPGTRLPVYKLMSLSWQKQSCLLLASKIQRDSKNKCFPKF